MSRARTLRHDGRHRAAPWVLLMLCLRALLPASVMLAPVAGHAALVLCDGAAPAHLHHHGHGPQGGTCPFAQSAGPAPLPALPHLTPAPVADATTGQARAPQTHPQPGPSRQQTPRGPPALT
ncbi:MAG: hypothetical protein JOZ67_04740 [Gammaproteobacteria bacterium]|nr:hypothetical protein [Gammaproteobacteria bacterium]MBV9696294.1 hypothetical protein [Gammaproteobacteria bacterium]